MHIKRYHELNEGFKYPAKIITIEVHDPEDQILGILETIKTISNHGHGFDVEIDKELEIENKEAGIKTHFYIDGDGGTVISKIDIKEIKKK